MLHQIGAWGWSQGGGGSRRGRRRHQTRGYYDMDEYRRQGQGRVRGTGQRRQIGFERLRDLTDEDNVENITLELASDKSGFESMLHSSFMHMDEVCLVLDVVVKITRTHHKEGLKKVLKMLCTSGFLETHLVRFIEQLRTYSEIEYNCDDVCVICQEILKKLPMYAEECIVALQCVGDVFYDSGLIHDNPELEAYRADLEETCIQHIQYGFEREDEEPPNNYRDLEMFPSPQELLADEKPFLRENKDKGAYFNLDTYLDVQFRLLREDYIQPLRKGILAYRQCKLDQVPNKVADTWLYHNVHIIRSICSDDVDTRLTFDVSRVGRIRWQSTKRLICGSLVCLSKDNFETMLFATVTNRTVHDLLKGNIDVRFEQDFDIVLNISPTDTFIMAETPAYFEAYRHVLSKLQQIEDSLPFQQYLVDCETNIQEPEYIDHSVRYNMTALGGYMYRAYLSSVTLLDTRKWPPLKVYNLNEVQLQAVKIALTKELAIIQGPPGTGKTYVGLKIMEVLLENKAQWSYPGSSNVILVVCYTNHALDQFLEGIHKFHPYGIIRVGGRSSSKILEPYNLKELRSGRRRKKKMRRIVHDNFWECKNQMAAIKNTIEEVGCRIEASMLGVLHEDVLRPHMELNHFRSLLKKFRMGRQSAILTWLEFRDLPASTRAEKTFQRLIDYWTKAILDYVSYQGPIKEDFFDNGQILSMPFVERAHMYKLWLEQFRFNVNREKEKIETQCQDGTMTNRGGHFILQKLTSQLKQAMISILPDALLQQFVPRPVYKLIKDTYSEHHEEYSIKVWLGATPLVAVVEDELYDAIEELDEINSGLSKADETAAIITRQRFVDDEVDIVSKRSCRPSVQMSKATNNLALSFQSLHYTKLHEGNQSANEQVQSAHKRKQKKRLEKILMEAQPINAQILQCRDVWDLNMNDRESLYKTWVTRYQLYCKLSIKDKEHEYRQLAKRLKEVLREEDKDILSQADIIGMTTTGAAKHAALLEAVAPRIVVVEEAAEVLESHIITALNPECQHLILIGDHQQLRPNPTVYELARKYNLDISLFERLVKNGLHHVTLEFQHRMRPEISVLMKHIYPTLKDHTSVTNFNSIRGVDKNVFFLSHQHREHHLNETMSKSNEHEASFIIALCKYFLLQGYEASDITILAAYTGQISLIKRLMGKENDLFLDVRLTSVDNFQGEECKIILLSFVRSNEEGSVGFLSIDNRICVALSRAKEGMFAFGDFTLFAEKSPLWASIVQTLRSTNSIGPVLRLRCRNHPEITVSVSSANDFDKAPRGGCTKSCGVSLMCGHTCDEICHVNDMEHREHKCQKPCKRLCDKCGQRCLKRCVQKCKCTNMVRKTIPKCGHTKEMQCDSDPSLWKCSKLCMMVLPCRHRCAGICGECKNVQYTLIQSRHMKCLKPCSRHLSCGHSCRGVCGDCTRNGCMEMCEEIVDVKLKCGHIYPTYCQDSKKNHGCFRECEQQLTCGHKCMQICRQCMFLGHGKKCAVSTKTTLPCGHVIESECHKSTLQMKCMKPCARHLSCGHSCRGVCGDCTRNGCMETCEEIVNVKLKCGHNYREYCHSTTWDFKCVCDQT
ncbi:NFX1-type zinc finger-containing protein 1-like [Haliotis rufescens]|uniref:NFX1-type zinc finger-containing protein 1-like n=1 Tax=Haliotis rufescens TaxID=6454 RepID=UPI00201E97A2|nr:NFX1-type zinc finger-containing protein 1-like [Haliotis rufescens]